MQVMIVQDQSSAEIYSHSQTKEQYPAQFSTSGPVWAEYGFMHFGAFWGDSVGT